jgi:hypothetical protein
MRHQTRVFVLTILSLVLPFTMALPIMAQQELTFNMPGNRFSVDRFSHATVRGFPGGVEIRATTRDPLFVTSTFMLPNGRFEVTRVVVHFRSDTAGEASLRSIQVADPHSGDILKQATNASGNRAVDLYTPASSANAWKMVPTANPRLIGAGATIRLGISCALPIDTAGAGEPFFLLSVDVFVKNPAFKVPPPSATVKPNANGAVTAVLSPPARPSPPPAAPAPPVSPFSAIPNLPRSKGVIYILNNANELMWYRNDGRDDGSFKWASDTGARVGIGWNYRTVIGAGYGVIYGITPTGDLVWYRHGGSGNGSFNWAQSQGQVVNTGFQDMQVIAAGGGVLYALRRNGDLLWFHHDGHADGTDRWVAREGRVIGSNWPRVQLFAGDGGVLYALTIGGELYRYHYDGRSAGSGTLAFAEGQKIASNWNHYRYPFSAGDGVIYVLSEDHQLLWFRDDGYKDDTVNWAAAQPKVVGVGWQFHSIFSGTALQP